MTNYDLPSKYEEEYSLEGPKENPLSAWSLSQCYDFADELDLSDDDFVFITQCFQLEEEQ
jgi:hypothetical protein